ncbi:MAG TPA: methylated-DNA--[protein]-cysteine S-methyltransferase [Deferrisomatales bacterium]|nr:methylated-DNA--[protein]-cysteine S-methyltransferase [Deferrisomatales bacterium]
MDTERCVLHTVIGELALEAADGAVVAVELHAHGEPPREPQGPVLRRTARQIRQYLAGTRRTFDVPLRRPADATPFQHRVWDALLAIPPGETRTYGELAATLGTSARAVGGACRRNPLPILVPCHRVVAKGGLGGFSGAWQEGPELALKRALLARERSDP